MQINLGIYVHDSKKEFSVLVDRSLGGSSIVDGQIELMLHRLLSSVLYLVFSYSYITLIIALGGY